MKAMAREEVMKGVAASFLMWPLFAASTSDFCTESQRVFLRGRLAYIRDEMGISQAEILMNVCIVLLHFPGNLVC